MCLVICKQMINEQQINNMSYFVQWSMNIPVTTWQVCSNRWQRCLLSAVAHISQLTWKWDFRCCWNTCDTFAAHAAHFGVILWRSIFWMMWRGWVEAQICFYFKGDTWRGLMLRHVHLTPSESNKVLDSKYAETDQMRTTKKLIKNSKPKSKQK